MTIYEALDIYSGLGTGYECAFIDKSNLVKAYDESDEFLGTFTQSEFIEYVEKNIKFDILRFGEKWAKRHNLI